MIFTNNNNGEGSGLVKSGLRFSKLCCLLLCIGFASTAYALEDFDYPYFNDFESVTSLHDDNTDKNPANDINGQADWVVLNDWSITGAHNAWSSYQGSYHLDNNSLEVDQNGHNDFQTAALNGFVNIPLDANAPTLSYFYKLNLLQYNDIVDVELQTEGSVDWVVVRSYIQGQNRSDYARDEIDLSAYKGQNITIRFVQRGFYTAGARLFVVDNFSIADLSLTELGYPYFNGFETAAEKTVWRMAGTWGIVADHNAWTSQSGAYHLDNNFNEVDQDGLYYEQIATLDGLITIPANSNVPTLSFAYKLDLLHYGDKVRLMIQESGSTDWVDLRVFLQQHNRSEYAQEEIDLSAYKGKTIRIRFWQKLFTVPGPRLFVVDDFTVGDRSLPQLAYPYSNGFETTVEKQQWRMSGTWDAVTDHGAWTSNAGLDHLDNNPLEVDQNGHNGYHSASMHGFVTIPVDATVPVLRFAYKSNQLHYNDMIQLQIQTEDSSNWLDLKVYYEQNNHDTYTREEIDLSAYKGQSIRVRFHQDGYWTSGARLFVVDDFSIAELGLAQQSYPYYNSFETADEQSHWDYSSSWGVAGDHNNWTSRSGVSHLDNNVYEVDQFNYNKNIVTTMATWVNIPLTSQLPTLSFYYKQDLLHYADEVFLEVQEEGNPGWVLLKKYTEQFDRDSYTLERFSLEAYKGKNIRIRFWQWTFDFNGPRLFVVDDLSFDDLAPGSFTYPYSNGFETAGEQQQWRTAGTWSMMPDHDVDWTSKTGVYHLDNNRNAMDQAGHYKDHFAEMDGFVTIPLDAVRPTLSYDYKVNQLNWNDMVEVQLQVQGSLNWTVLYTYLDQHNRSIYTHEDIDLSAYKGQSVRIAFVQSGYWSTGARLFVVDNLNIGEQQLPTFAYPFSTGFDTAEEAQQWRMGGTWNVAPATAGRPSLSGTSHLDNNPAEVDEAEHGTGHYAVMEGYVDVPPGSVQPVLTYQYQLNLVHESDEIFVRVQAEGSSDWVQLRAYSFRHNKASYSREELSLAAYAGQKIRIGFFHKYSQPGVRLFIIDDLSIADLQLPVIGFPYQTNFDDPQRNTEWWLQGIWSIAAAHNAWTSNSGIYHLDGNAAETDLRLYKHMQTATLNGFVTIPVASQQPVVNFRHQLYMVGVEAFYNLEIQTADNANWTTLKTYRNTDNTTGYSYQEFSLDAYKGQAVRLRFHQDNQWDNGASAWTIDDFNILDLSGVQTDTDGDGVPDAIDAFPNDPAEWADQDGDGVGDNADLFDNDPTEWSDLDGDGIGDNSDTERDGDGVANDQDSYPNDPTRFQLSAVQNVQLTQQTAQLTVSWDAHEETGAILQGYNVYRADYAQTNWLQINTALLTDVSYIDDTVQNGQAYQYRVEAVDINNIVGASSATLNHFIIYNTTVIEQSQASWQNYLAQIDWTHSLQAAETYRLYRIDNAVRNLVYEGTANQFIDNATLWNQAYQYELVSVLTFNNPITTQNQSLEGPVSQIALAALPAIELSLPGAQTLGNNQYQIEALVGSQLTLSGQYANALADIQLDLSTAQGSLSATSNNGSFQFVLRDLQLGSMSLTLVEVGAPVSRTLTVSINVVADQTPMAVVVNGDTNVTTGNSSIVIEGQVLNADGGVRALTANNARYGSDVVDLIIGADNAFYGEVPLQTGDNTITLQAVNGAGETAVTVMQVNRQASVIPSVVFTSHQNNQTVSAQRIDLSGSIYTSLAATQIKLSVNNQTAVITPLANQQYQFEVTQLTLNNGYNRLVALTETPAGNIETAIVIYYNDAQPAQQPALRISLTTPTDNQAARDDTLIVRGQLFNVMAGNENTASVLVNGTSTQLFGSADTGLLFSYGIDISTVTDAVYPVTIDASANGQDPVQRVVNVIIDRVAPVITLDNTLLVQPAVNEVREVPYVISGSVTDSHLASLSINGQGLVLQPAGGDSYTFSTGLNMTAGVDTALNIIAADSAGNQQTLSYTLLSSPQASIEIVEPLEQAEITTAGASFALQYITRINGLSPADLSTAQLVVIAGSAQQSMPISQEIIAGAININTAETIEHLRFEVRNAVNELLASREVAVSLINGDNIPLGLLATEPESNEQNYEPHYPVKFFFNRTVDLSLATVTVKETFHGKTYANEILSGAQLDQVYKGELVEVHRDQALVDGGLSLVPGGQVVEFYPHKDLAYGASVTVSIDYNGQNLKRFNYKVRPAPTFVMGAVLNQLQQPLAGIEVSLPQLGLTATTNKDGVFSFGQGLTAKQNIPSGNYRLVVNGNHGDPTLAMKEQVISVVGGQKNDGYSAVVPVLDPHLSYQYVRSGTAQNVLAGSDLVLSTTGMRLQFAGGEDAGKVHVQMTHMGEGTYSSNLRSLNPLWVYQLQPAGIRVFQVVDNSSLGIEINMPSLYGSDAYIPEDGTYVVLMGTDEDTLKLTPIGVGRVENKKVISEGKINMPRLDYIGYSFVPGVYQTNLEDYANGRIDLNTLIGLLAQE